MAAEERTSSAGRPDLDLGDPNEPDEGEPDEAVTVAGGLCRLSAPDSTEPRSPGS